MKMYRSRGCCRLLSVLLSVFLAAGCGSFSNPVQPGEAEAAETESAESEETGALDLPAPGLPEGFDLSMVPEYNGSIWADVNEDVPFFTEKQLRLARNDFYALYGRNFKDKELKSFYEQVQFSIYAPMKDQPEQDSFLRIIHQQLIHRLCNGLA